MKDKYFFYVGQLLPPLNLTYASLIGLRGQTKIIDRKPIGIEVDEIHYAYRLDTGNPLVELWVTDDILMGALQ